MLRAQQPKQQRPVPRLNNQQILNATDTHFPSTTRTSRASLERLKRRYDLLVARHRCLPEILAYLAANGDHRDQLDPFRIAERAFAPNGHVGRGGLAFDAAIIYWMAANDRTPEIVATVEDRRAHYLR